ncbi:Metallopeptidase, family M24 [Roseibacterium elongatum DSM 19469]|uniref:Metallopeptidase, family M24 n=1 Tax=Roseicyclus elongatus DSM 19469 TaxID=1294273 RepID=W8S364_9RHOB|nr:Xaa-Pro peptidase family protein [Roseibacterium elongatum]AHM03201.1 Metallopeptidase, family M24 [Roseibacterium elongatum DSM 19469]
MPDFAPEEYAQRVARAQDGMARAGIDALLVTTEAELRYFTGFRTAFWQSPTRPWFLVLPARGQPIAIIPTIGVALMAATGLTDIRPFDSPAPDAPHIPILRQALAGVGTIGMPMGAESALRMPLAEFEALRASLRADWVDATPLIRGLRMIKSPAEQQALRDICTIGSRAFARAPELFHIGQPLEAAFRAFRIALLQDGAEEVPYLVGAADQGGYGDVISPPSGRPLAEGDILMLDTGASKLGYFCDFDRNWAIAHASPRAMDAHARLFAATEAALAALRPGMTAAALHAVMAQSLGHASAVGRLGHGLGMQLTEWPSLAPHDDTILRPGMVLTLEPSLEIAAGKMMVHEENVLLTEDGVELLSARTPPDLPVIG